MTRLVRVLMSVFSAAVIATAGVTGAAAAPLTPQAGATAARGAAPDAALLASPVVTTPVAIQQAAPAPERTIEATQPEFADCASTPNVAGPYRPHSAQNPQPIASRAARHCTPAQVVAPDAASVTISGTVRNAAAAGLPGIYVEVCQITPRCVYYDTTTAGDGTYSVAVAPNYDYQLYFDDPSGTYAGGWYSNGGVTFDFSVATIVSVTSSDVSGQDVTMPTASHISGTVRNAAAAGLANIDVSACPITSGSASCYGTTTIANGTYSIAVMPNYSYALGFDDYSGTYAGGWYNTGGITTDLDAASLVSVASSDVSGTDIILPGAIHISGTVRNAAGAGLANIDVYARVITSGIGSSYWAVTLADGTYSVGVAPNKSYTLIFIDRSGPYTGGYYSNGGIASDYAHASHISVTSSDLTGKDVVLPLGGATFRPLSPARILDTRNGTGLSGPSGSHSARTFQVTGQGGVPANAIAVTGNLTVTGQTSKGYLFVGPNATNNPTSSTLNFPIGDDRANGVTVALGAGGTLSVTFVAPSPGPTAHVIFDVTGYFVPGASGATYLALTPTRLLDTRNGTGLSGPSSSHAARTFQVTGHGGVPSDAAAVTGNLTVTGQTSSGYLFLGPVAENNPTSSTLNFPVGDDRANGVTVALGAGGTLSVTYVASAGAATAHVIFDVTGYFVPDASGSRYVPLTPARIADTRNGTGMTGPSGSHAARAFQVSGMGGVLLGATAVTGNLTVTGQTSNGYLFLGPVGMNDPTSSTLNFPVGDDRANGVTVALSTGGTLGVTFVAPAPGPVAHVIFDVTGYFLP